MDRDFDIRSIFLSTQTGIDILPYAITFGGSNRTLLGNVRSVTVSANPCFPLCVGKGVPRFLFYPNPQLVSILVSGRQVFYSEKYVFFISD